MMVEKKVGKFTCIFVITCMLLAVGLEKVWAKKVYVSDSTVEINVRTGPSFKNKIIAVLKVGEPLELIDVKAGWAYVQLSDGRTGWTLNKYLMNRLPWKFKIDQLTKINQEISASLADIKEKNQKLKQEKIKLMNNLNKTNKKLQELKKNYESLKNGASTYLALKNSYDKLTENSALTEKEVNELRIQNNKLKTSQNIRWFLSGAVVLILGWLIGLQMGKAKKRGGSRLYYD